MSIFNFKNWYRKKDGFYYHMGCDKVIFSKLKKVEAISSGSSGQKKLYGIENFCFYQNNIRISYFENITIDEQRNIITINHFAVDTDYLFKLNQRGGGVFSLEEFAKEIKKQLPSVNEIGFELYKNGTNHKISNNELADKRVKMLQKIKAIGIQKKAVNNSHGTYEVIATWPKSNWP